jgi:GH15 family glucan-1,4-alpha-glucosidase
MISCLALMGRIDEARRWFEQMLTYANDVGLYSEEIDAATGAHVGNFPQAFTHIALINAAADLGERKAAAAR